MKLSIITICYNDAEGLRKTLASVDAQNIKDFEHVIVDGASKDDSPSIIQEYANVASCAVKWISEPDSGIYNAMNKGIRMATGEYLLFLNSGDVLHNADVVSLFLNSNVNADIATAYEQMPSGQQVAPPQEENLTYSFFFNDTLLHQSTFIRKDAFDKYGLYREDYRIVSDWEWFFRVMVRDEASYQALDFIVADFDGGGMSCSPKFRKLQDEEREQVHQEILPRVRQDYQELIELRIVANEYRMLKDGIFGPLVKFLLTLKAKKKKCM